MKILISDSFYPELVERLSIFGTVTTNKSEYTNADVILIRSETKANKLYLENAKKLKCIIRGGVGVDNIDLTTAEQLGIKVCNTPKASSVAVAEMAMTLMLSLPNHLVKADNSMHNNEWLKKQLKRSELYGKTLGIIGYGRIGNEVAHRAKAFGMKILGYHYREIKSEYGPVYLNLKKVLNQSDFISLHLPLTNETVEILDELKLKECKPGAFIINTGRGGTVDESALANELSRGHIGGYASDVWQKSSPTDSPLMNAPNVLMTPHLGASTQECMYRIGEEIIDILTHFTKNPNLN